MNNNSKVKLVTLVEGNPKAPFSIATTPRCRGGRYSFPGIAIVSVQVVHPYSSIDTTAGWKKLRFVLSVRSEQISILKKRCEFLDQKIELEKL